MYNYQLALPQDPKPDFTPLSHVCNDIHMKKIPVDNIIETSFGFYTFWKIGKCWRKCIWHIHAPTTFCNLSLFIYSILKRLPKMTEKERLLYRYELCQISYLNQMILQWLDTWLTNQNPWISKFMVECVSFSTVSGFSFLGLNNYWD